MRLAPQVMRLTVRDEAGRVETIVVTENHPYLRADGTVDLLRAVALEPRGAFDELQQSRWTGAGFLKAGDTLQSALTRSAPGTLTVVSSEVVLAPTPVYNFEVAGDHTYAVGELAAWVHNSRNRDIRNRIGGLQKQVDKHKEKIRNDPNSQAVNHWEKEIKNWECQIKKLREKLPNRK